MTTLADSLTNIFFILHVYSLERLAGLELISWVSYMIRSEGNEYIILRNEGVTSHCRKNSEI